MADDVGNVDVVGAGADANLTVVRSEMDSDGIRSLFGCASRWGSGFLLLLPHLYRVLALGYPHVLRWTIDSLLYGRIAVVGKPV